MKAIFLISLSLLLASQVASIRFPEGGLRAYKTFIRGQCIATETDCDLSTIRSCWDDKSGALALRLMYNIYDYATSGYKEETGDLMKEYLSSREALRLGAELSKTMHCEMNLPYGKALYGRLSNPENGLQEIFVNLVNYATHKPKEAYFVLQHIVELAEERDFGAVGLINGNLFVISGAFSKEGTSQWPKNPKKATQTPGNKEL